MEADVHRQSVTATAAATRTETPRRAPAVVVVWGSYLGAGRGGLEGETEAVCVRLEVRDAVELREEVCRWEGDCDGETDCDALFDGLSEGESD